MKIAITFVFCLAAQSATIKIGSKPFTENSLLAEMISQVIETVPGYKVERKFGIAGNKSIMTALTTEEIDIYPDYTGTISQVHLKMPNVKGVNNINEKLKERGLKISDSLGFKQYLCPGHKKRCQREARYRKNIRPDKSPKNKIWF